MQTTDIPLERLKTLLNYSPHTGKFTWAMTRRKCRLGDIVGCQARHGYIFIRLDDKLYTAHRLAWFYTFGTWPIDQIDHINGDRADNRIKNLREATNAENAQNKKPRKNNSSGFTGVRRENRKWLAEIKLDYVTTRLGLFDTPEDAYAAYVTAKQLMHPFSNH